MKRRLSSPTKGTDVAPRIEPTDRKLAWALSLLLSAVTLLNLLNGHSSTPTAVFFNPEIGNQMGRVLSYVGLAGGLLFLVGQILRHRVFPPVLMFLSFFYAALLLSDLLSARNLSQTVLMTWLVVVSIALLAETSTDVTRVIRNLLLVYILLNAASLLLIPQFALQQGYVGFLPVRLHGLANQANSLGPYAVLSIVTLIVRPLRGVLPNAFFVLLSLSLLLLTQSKTSLVLLALLSLFTLPYLTRRTPSIQRLGLFLLVTPICMLVIGISLDRAGTVDALLNDDNVVTLTGRTAIWTTALDAWRSSPWYGYGYSRLWNEDMRYGFELLYGWRPGYSHNQIVQTLGQAGWIGLTTLIALIGSLFIRAWSVGGDLRWLLVGLLTTFYVVRGQTEVPLGLPALSDNTVLQVLVFLLLVWSTKPKES